MPQCLAADSGCPWMRLSVPARAEGKPGTSLRHKDDKTSQLVLAEALMWVLLWKYTLALFGLESPVLTPIPSFANVTSASFETPGSCSTGFGAWQ